MKKPNVHQQIIDVAEHLVQTRGYNAFSYRDIAEMVGIKTSSIHYYFPAKADLGKAIVERHIEALSLELDNLSANKKLSCKKKLELFIDAIFAKTYFSDRKMCLGGMLASDVLTLPESIQHEVRIFFNRIENWIEHLLIESIVKKDFSIAKKDVKNEAMLILLTLEGALLLSRLFQDESHLTIAKKYIMARLIKD